MDTRELLQDDVEKRKDALSRLASEPSASQTALARDLAERAAELAATLAHAVNAGEDTDDLEEHFERVARALASIDAPEASLGLSTASRHVCALVRKKVVLALFQVRSAAARTVLEGLVRDPDEDVRDSAADAVHAGPWAGATDALLAGARAEQDPVRACHPRPRRDGGSLEREDPSRRGRQAPRDRPVGTRAGPTLRSPLVLARS